MKGETHVTGGFLVKDKLRVPIILLFLMIKPSLTEALLIYLIYNAVTTAPTRIGAVIADYDQNVIENTPNVLTEPWHDLFFNFLKRIGSTHRSYHSHNIDLWGIILGVPAFVALGMFINTKNDIWFIFFIYLFSYFTGVLSHMFLDMLTISGINPSFLVSSAKKRKYKNSRDFKKYLSQFTWRIVPLNRDMYKLKPIRIFKIKTPLFRIVKIKFPQNEWLNCGGGWEDYIHRRMTLERYKHTTIKNHIYDLIVILLVYNTLVS